MPNLESEQDLIVNVVLRFLNNLGFRPDEIKTEKSFSLQLGHYVYRVDTAKQLRRAAPRLDILITRNGSNLFIVEAKRDGSPLTDDDRLQAISYGRVVHPIAPFVVLTNGVTTKLFDTLTRDEISPSTFPLKDKYELTLTLEQERSFFHDFIGYSYNNLRVFARAQVESRTRALVGSPTQKWAKYIPELYEPRQKLEAELQAFFSSDAPGFVILGDSGMGKTSALCHLALSGADIDPPFLFYRGFDLESSLLGEITDDFNWQFTAQYSEIELVRRLLTLHLEKPIVVVLDAVDEWTSTTKASSLVKLLRRLPGHRLKLVLTCKTAAWSQFTSYRGTLTGIEDFLYLCADRRFFRLEAMDPREFHRAYQKHQKVFGFEGYFEDRLLREMERNVFLMRISFEIAATGVVGRLILSNRELLVSYHRACLLKIGTRESERASAEDLLDRLAEAIFSLNQSSVTKSDVRRIMGATLDDRALEELTEYNIVERDIMDVDERLGFYFAGLRDYIISFRLRRWHRLEAAEFSAEVARLEPEGVHQEVLVFFYPLADERKRELIDGPLRRRAREYLDFYRQILTDHFGRLRERFAPFTSGMIGFIGQLIIPERDLGFFGFRRLTEKDEEILLLPSSRFDSSSNMPDLYGGEAMHGFGQRFIELDWRKVVIEREIGDQLKSIVGMGLLDESQNPDLLGEFISALVCEKRYMFKRYGSQSFEDLFPLDLEEALEGLREHELEEYYREKKAEEKIALGELKEGGFSFPGDFTDNDLEAIRRNVDSAMKSGQVAHFTGRRIPSDAIRARFLIAKAGLNALGTSVIEAPILDLGLKWAVSGVPLRSIDFIRDQFMILYPSMVANYQALIERNFWSLKDYFWLYSNLPARFLVNIEKPSHYDRHDYRLTLIICQGQAAKNEVIYFTRDEIAIEEIRRGNHQVTHRGVTSVVLKHYIHSLSHFLLSPDPHSNIQLSTTHLLLRGLVYRHIQEELPRVRESLKQVYFG